MVNPLHLSHLLVSLSGLSIPSDSEVRSSGVDIGSSSVGGSTEVQSELEDSDFGIES